jgi:hypothetical protein
MTNAFISYSHRDKKALERLHVHLAALRRERTISTWYDREILAGADIDDEIRLNLAQADIFLALVSPDFLASSYCYEKEMQSALERYAAGTLRVVPVILEPCDWMLTPLGKLKAIPNDGMPVSTWTNENSAYLDVVKELRRLCSPQTRPTFDTSAKTNSTQAGFDRAKGWKTAAGLTLVLGVSAIGIAGRSTIAAREPADPVKETPHSNLAAEPSPREW